MKNQQLAELEKRAGAAKPAPVAPLAKAPEPAKPVAKAPEPAKPAPEPVKQAAKAPEPAKPAAEPAKAPEAAKPAAKAPEAAPKTKAAPKKAAPPPEPDLVDEVVGFVTDPVSGGGLAGVLVLLGGYGWYAWRRKKSGQATKFQDSVLGATTGGAAGSVFPAAAAAEPQAAAAPAASEASAGAPSIGAAEAEEVDPIAEADVYMAYGRDAQAEEILKEALGKDAARVAVHAKLLEIYAGRKDTKAFEQTALKLKGLTEGSGPEWEKAMALGHSIDPGNGLYGAGGVAPAPAAEAAPAAAGAAPALDFDLGGGTGATPAVAGAKPDATGPLDFDLGATAAGGKSDFAPSGTLIVEKEAKAESTGLDFDLGGGGTEDEKTVVAPKAGDPDATVTMDFDLNLDVGGAKPEAAAEPAKADAPLDLGSFSLDLGGAGGAAPAAGADPKWQEIATKLDLAKAYEEMGDKDGARELLNEVLKEGDAAQQGQAQQMLANLS